MINNHEYNLAIIFFKWKNHKKCLQTSVSMTSSKIWYSGQVTEFLTLLLYMNSVAFLSPEGNTSSKKNLRTNCKLRPQELDFGGLQES